MAKTDVGRRLGEAVAAYRTAHGLTQRDFGARAGLAHSTVVNVEKGNIGNFETALRAARAASVDLGELLDSTAEPPPPHLTALLRRARQLSSGDLQLLEAVADRFAEGAAELHLVAEDSPEYRAERREIDEARELALDRKDLPPRALEHIRRAFDAYAAARSTPTPPGSMR